MTFHDEIAPGTIRQPNSGSGTVMTRRAWWLLVLNFLLPGLPQLLAGNRKLGRFGMIVTGLLWLTVIVLILCFTVFGVDPVGLATNLVALWIAQILLFGFAIFLVLMTLDTIRLTALVKVKPRSRIAVPAIAVVVALVVGGGAAYAGTIAGASRNVIGDVFSQAEVEPPIDGRYNVLLLGADSGDDREGLRPDSISVVSVDATTGQAVQFGLPRTMEVSGFPGYDEWPAAQYCGSPCKLNYLYPRVMAYDPELYPKAEREDADSGIVATREAVEQILGTPIQFYILIDMKGFESMIDALGGVQIDVTERQPIEGWIDETTGELTGVNEWIEPGLQTLDGYHALWYGRSRLASTDYDRMQRQRQLQQAILAQFDPVNVLAKFQDIAGASSDVVTTDIPAGNLSEFLSIAMKTKELPVESVEFVPPLVSDEVPDFPFIVATVAETLSNATATPTPATQE